MRLETLNRIRHRTFRQPSSLTRSLCSDRHGLALVATLLVVVLIAVVIAAAISTAMTTTRSVTADHESMRAFYAAEAGAEHALTQVELALQDGFLSDAELDAITPPTIAGFVFTEFGVAKDGPFETVPISDGPFANLYAITQDITITSRATGPSGAHAAVELGAQAQAIPLFQFAEFGHGAMEAYTGSYSETSGRSHVNGDIYLATNDHHILTSLTTPGRFIRDGRVAHKSKSDINIYVKLSDNSEVEVDFDSEDTPDPEEFTNRSDSELEGKIRTGAMGVDSLNLPLPPGIEPYELIRPREGDDTESERAAKFAWQADMYVTIDLTDIRNAADVCGAPVPWASKLPAITVERPYGGVVPDDGWKCSMFPFKWEAFFDWQEMRWVDAANVNVGNIRNWGNPGGPGDRPRIIYVEIIPSTNIVHEGVTSRSDDDLYWPALRVLNGSRLPGPLTVGSMYPLYMQGHYNDTNWQPAAVFGDRLTGLSECWTDPNSPNPQPTGGDNPNACDTYQYYAVVTGWSEGNLGCYHHGPDPGCDPIPAGKSLSVGIQNLEDWRSSPQCSGRCDYWIIGSFINFWAPHIANKWGNEPNPNRKYKAPSRNWSFDPRFMDPENLPPGTPNVGYVLRASFRESY